ncbi:hypothetical protein B0I35DRAFT_443271 [Stachybotrys elegans]|uniref:SMP-30/Gluconolactonase/LRE-like region domain-containing protein n=1 Tax=Stachybotrys elegans TaxID=80388 RepID=A0A8K0SGD1_9HYPO|nr:hypothetical protein B0I35DRAFT_443271 [Stachybotrys elegans]
MRSDFVFAAASLLSQHAMSASNCAPGPQTRQLVELPGVFIENVAVRENGDIIMTTFDDGRIYTVTPSSPNPEARVAVQLEGLNALTGIVEVAPDVFAVAANIVDKEVWEFVVGATRIALVDFTPVRLSQDGTPAVDYILDLGDFGVSSINGMTSLPSQPNILLGADSVTGQVWRMDILSRKVELAFLDEDLVPGPSGPLSLSVNGVHAYKDHLYYTNSNAQTFGRVPIDRFGRQTGQSQVFLRTSNSTLLPDDFAIDQDGNALVAYWPNTLMKITSGGQDITPLVETLVNPTAVALNKDGRKAYIVTAGESRQRGRLVEVEF